MKYILSSLFLVFFRCLGLANPAKNRRFLICTAIAEGINKLTYVFLLVLGFFKQKSKILYFDIMKYKRCVSLRLTFVVKTKTQRPKEKKQRMLPKKPCRQSRRVVVFGQRIHPSFSACRFLFFGAANGPVSVGYLEEDMAS